MSGTRKTDFAALVQAFFTHRLILQRQASKNTIAAYRDTFRLLIRFAQDILGKAPTELSVTDIDASIVSNFLDHLEGERKNSVRTRNVRLAAIHSFFRYVALEEPAHAAVAQRILALPSKRSRRRMVAFLNESEITALLAAPDLNTKTGRRDRVLLLLALQAGLRVSEITGLRIQDVTFGPGAHVFCLGKGRKERHTPLRRDTSLALRQWLRERRGKASDPLFPNAQGNPLTRDGVAHRLSKHVAVARRTCPSFRNKRVTPHVLRHTAAMTLLHSGVDRSVIALWLGHEKMESTDIYLHADLKLKEKALSKTNPSKVVNRRYQPPDHLLAFLEGL